jgi:hypothetical protein
MHGLVNERKRSKISVTTSTFHLFEIMLYPNAFLLDLPAALTHVLPFHV